MARANRRSSAGLAIVVLVGALALSSPSRATEALPDLVVVGTIQIRNTTLADHVEPGEFPMLRVTILNQGPGTAGNFSVHFAAGGTLLGNVPFRGTIPPGDRVNVTSRAWWNATAGPHEARVVIDFWDSQPEVDEANNKATRPLLVGHPDLVQVGSWTSPPHEPAMGDPIRILVSMRNAGSIGLRDPSVHLQLIRSDGMRVIDLQTVASSGWLAPGEMDTVSFPWVALPGDWTLRGAVDAGDGIDEILPAAEANNDFEEHLHVRHPLFRIGNLWSEPRDPVVGEAVVLRATLQNVGDADGASDVAFRVGGVGGESVGSSTPYNVPAGGAVEVVGPRWTARLGQLGPSGYNDRFLLYGMTPPLGLPFDPDHGRPWESAGGDIHVRAPDPEIPGDSIRVSTPSLSGVSVPAGPYIVGVALGNNGTAPVLEPVSLELRACPRGVLLPVAQGCDIIANLTVPAGQPPGSVAHLDARWDTFGAAGDFDLCARLSYAGPELRPSNNAACIQGTVALGLGGHGVNLGP